MQKNPLPLRRASASHWKPSPGSLCHFQTTASRIGNLSILPPEIRYQIYESVAPSQILVCYPELYKPTKEQSEARKSVHALQILDHEAMETIFLQSTFVYELNFSGCHTAVPPSHTTERFSHIAFRIDFTNFLRGRGPNGEKFPDSDQPRVSEYYMRHAISHARVLAAQTLGASVKLGAKGKSMEIEFHGYLDNDNGGKVYISGWPVLYDHLIPSGFFQPLKRMSQFSTVTVKFLGKLHPCPTVFHRHMSEAQKEYVGTMRKQLAPALGPADPVFFTKTFDPKGAVKITCRMVFHPYEHRAEALSKALEKMFPLMSIAS